MTGLPLIFAFIIAIVVMIVMISKFKIHPFISIMSISLILGLLAGILLLVVSRPVMGLFTGETPSQEEMEKVL